MRKIRKYENLPSFARHVSTSNVIGFSRKMAKPDHIVKHEEDLKAMPSHTRPKSDSEPMKSKVDNGFSRVVPLGTEGKSTKNFENIAGNKTASEEELAKETQTLGQTDAPEPKHEEETSSFKM